MELLGLLVVLAAFAEKFGKALGWCLVTLTKGFAILLVAVIRLIIAAIIRRHRTSTEDKSDPANTTVNPNTEDVVAGLTKLGLPMGAAKKIVTEVARDLGPRASAKDLLSTALQRMDQR